MTNTNTTINTLTYRGAKKLVLEDVKSELAKIQNNFGEFSSNLTRFCEVALYNKTYKVRNKEHAVIIKAYRDEEVNGSYEFDIEKYMDSLKNLKIHKSLQLDCIGFNGYMVSVRMQAIC